MSLIDPDNPARWSDGTERSLNNCFTQTVAGEHWQQLDSRARNGKTNSSNVQRRRAAGEKVGSMSVMGRNPQAVFSIENRAKGEKSRDKRTRILKGGI